MRGTTTERVTFTADRAGLALLLAMVLFAGSLMTALSASATTKDKPGNPGTSNSESHGNPGNSEGNGNPGNSEGKGNPGNSEGNGNEGNSHGKPNNAGKSESKSNDASNSSNGKSNGKSNGNSGKSNGKSNGKGKAKGHDKKEELPDVTEEPSTPDEVLGARLVRARLLLTYRNHAFRGRVLARRDRCVSGRKVTVKRRNGTVIGRDKTDKRGRFSISARKRTGSFKARVGRKSFVRQAADIKVVCLADTTKLRIKSI